MRPQSRFTILVFNLGRRQYGWFLFAVDGIEMPVCVLKAAGDVQHDPDSDSTCLLFVSFLSCGVLSHTNTAGEM